jgi:flavodoxin
VGDVKPEHVVGLDVLVVGSPTRAFSPTPAIKRWVSGLPSKSLQGVKVGAFDTRIALEDVDSALLTFMAKIFGYAAKPIGDRLVKKGGDRVLSLEGFYVQDSEGPLKDGELERAADWVREIL